MTSTGQGSLSSQVRPRRGDRFWHWAILTIAIMAIYVVIALWPRRSVEDYGIYLGDFGILVYVIVCLGALLPMAALMVALNSLRSRNSWRWVTAALSILGTVMSCAYSYKPVLDRVWYGGMFSGATRYQIRVGETIVRLAALPAGEFLPSWLDVWECKGSAMWCRYVGSVSADAGDQGRLPERVELKTGEHDAIEIYLEDKRVAELTEAGFRCDAPEGMRCR